MAGFVPTMPPSATVIPFALYQLKYAILEYARTLI